MRWQKPLPLRPRSPVRVIAPSGPFDRESFDAGLARLSERYSPRYEPSLFDRQRYLAGSDRRRLEELHTSMAEPDVGAIFSARGGYGAMRLLPRLKLDTSRPPAALIGFSDITALHGLWQSQGLVSFHAPVLTQLGRLPEAAFARLTNLLESSEPAPALDARETFVPGVAEGRLVGGNLAVLVSLMGSPYLPPFEGNILLLEDVGERPYRLDRMWTHLQLAGVFDKLAGIALGDFTACEEKDADYSARDVLSELARATGLPCAFGFPVGHGSRNEAVPLGVRVRLDATAKKLTFLESAVERA